MASDGLNDTGAQFAAELIDHAGDPRPAGVVGVRSDSLIDLAGGEHLPWPAGQQEEKFATEARAVMVFAKAVSSPSLKDRIINFP